MFPCRDACWLKNSLHVLHGAYSCVLWWQHSARSFLALYVWTSKFSMFFCTTCYINMKTCVIRKANWSLCFLFFLNSNVVKCCFLYLMFDSTVFLNMSTLMLMSLNITKTSLLNLVSAAMFVFHFFWIPLGGSSPLAGHYGYCYRDIITQAGVPV